jgi:hypothetical protein
MHNIIGKGDFGTTIIKSLKAPDGLIKITLHHGILQRIGAVALIVGGILIFPNVLFPRPDDPSDHAWFLSLLVENISQTKVVMLAVPLVWRPSIDP